jgi:hypothetical protein
LNLSETADSDYRGMRMELTAYKAPDDNKDKLFGLAAGHGTQIDSASL